MTTKRALVKAEDLLRSPLSGKRCELIEGVVVEMPPPGERHADLAAEFVGRLWEYARAHGGKAWGEVGVWVSREPDTVREPDAAYTTAPRQRVASSGLTEVIPDLVVEVVSPNDTAREVLAKAAMWLDAGVRLVWIAYPEEGYVAEYRSKSESRLLSGEDVLDGGDVLPGCSAAVKDILA